MPPPKMKKKKEAKNMMQKIKGKKATLKNLVKGIIIHGGLLLVVMLYAIAGAYILILIERPDEETKVQLQEIATSNVEQSRNYIKEYVLYLYKLNKTEKEFKSDVKQKLETYHYFVVKNALNNYYDGTTGAWNYAWTFPKSFLFTFTTMGAIGYGHIVPKTSTGQFFTVYYGMIGVPLLLLFLANIGEFLANSFRYIYSRFCCRMCRIRRHVSELNKNQKVKKKVLWKEEVGYEPYMPTNHVDVPIVVNLCVIYVYLMLGGALFSYWENWEMYDAVYFSFITLTTIGFGDFVPGNSFSSSGDLSSSIKMVVTIAFCIFGMALLSMAINLMQEQLVSKAKWLAKEIGISEKDPDETIQYKVIKHQPGSVHETPPDKDGNQVHLPSSDVMGPPGERKKLSNFL